MCFMFCNFRNKCFGDLNACSKHTLGLWMKPGSDMLNITDTPGTSENVLLENNQI